MHQTRTVHIRIEGLVQGVGFRYWLKNTALRIGLAGWVANRHDRAVEAVLQGLSGDVDDLLTRCKHGPPGAHVAAVVILGEGVGVYDGFEIRATL
jgi:acylphosphatase